MAHTTVDSGHWVEGVRQDKHEAPEHVQAPEAPASDSRAQTDQPATPAKAKRTRPARSVTEPQTTEHRPLSQSWS